MERLLAALSGEMKRDELQSALGLAGRGNVTVHYLKPAFDAGLIEMTIVSPRASASPSRA